MNRPSLPLQRAFAWLIAVLGAALLVALVILEWPEHPHSDVTTRTGSRARSGSPGSTPPTAVDSKGNHRTVDDPGRAAFRELAVTYLACFGLPIEPGVRRRDDWKHEEADRLRKEMVKVSGAEGWLLEMLQEDAWMKPHESWHLLEALRGVATPESLPLSIRMIMGEAPYSSDDWLNARAEALALALQLREPIGIAAVKTITKNRSLADYRQMARLAMFYTEESGIPEAFDILRSMFEDPTLEEDFRDSSFGSISRLGTIEATQYVWAQIASRGRDGFKSNRMVLHDLAEHADESSKEFIRFRILSEADPDLQSRLWGAVAPHIDGSPDLATVLGDASNPKARQRAARALGAIRTRMASEILLAEFAKLDTPPWLRKEIASAVPEEGLEADLFESVRRLFFREVDPEVRNRLGTKIALQLTPQRADAELVQALRLEVQALLQAGTEESFRLAGRIVEGLAQVKHSMAGDVLGAIDRISAQPAPSHAGLVTMLRPLRNEPAVGSRLESIASEPSLPREWRLSSVETMTMPDVFKANRRFLKTLYEREQDEEVSYSIIMRSLDSQDVEFLADLQSHARKSSQPFRPGEARILKEMIPILTLLKTVPANP